MTKQKPPIPETARQLVAGDITFREYFAGLSENQRIRGDANLLARLLEDTPRVALNEQEWKILALAALGLSTNRICDELGINYHTQQSSRKRIFDKLGANGMNNAIAIAVAAQLEAKLTLEEEDDEGDVER